MTDDPRLAPLAAFTAEKALQPGYGDSYIFFAGQDAPHAVLAYLLVHETQSLTMSMYSYDDDVLNSAVVTLLKNPAIRVQMTLDLSQSVSPNNPHEKAILSADSQLGPSWSNSVSILSSPSGQIAHTKGGVLGGLGIAFEGSVNWSASGEGSNPKIAQNNTLVVTTNPVFLSRFTNRLNLEHKTGRTRLPETLSET